MVYDYSKIGDRSWTWEYEKKEYITIHIKPLGLVYYGDLQTGPYSGGYTAEFQTWGEFFKKECLKKNRCK